MTSLRVFVLLALVALCSGSPAEKTLIHKKSFFPHKVKPFIKKRLPFYGCYWCPKYSVCAGKGWRKRCVFPVTIGKKCGGNPYLICQKGLLCKKNICVLPPVPVHGDCTSRGSVCVPKAVCVGPALKKICVKPRGPGRRCGKNPYKVCKKGLECWRGRCVKPKIGLGGDCKPIGSVCDDGLFCLGDNGLKKCVKGVTKGLKCGLDPFWSCQPGLSCVRRICV